MLRLRHIIRHVAALAIAAPALYAQGMPPSAMPGMSESMRMTTPQTLIDAEFEHTSSGTSIEPFSSPVSMWMGERGGWRLMLHGSAFVADTQQHATASPRPPSPSLCSAAAVACTAGYRRGGDKLFSTNWIMPMAQRRFGREQLTLRTMLDLEPATIFAGEYPELFQQGETVHGRPIIDGQHPHSFVMELAAISDLRTGEHTLLSLYAAPVGDPAFGPTPYPHRLSASEDPIAALGHHQQDSTHIAFNVLGAGFTWRSVRIEASGFHGAEPTEARWHLQPSPNGLAIDSYSARLTVAPTPDLSAQYSIARITAPEQLFPKEDQRRQSASLMYNRRFGHDQPDAEVTNNWANTLLWGQTRSLTDGTTSNSYLLESLLRLHRNSLWTRMESAARTSELLDTPQALPVTAPIPAEVPVGHVLALSLGYDREYKIAPHLSAAPGGQFTLYRSPDALASAYGRTPYAGTVFVRLRIAQ